MHCRIILTTPDCFGFSSLVFGEFKLMDDARLATSSEVMEAQLSSAQLSSPKVTEKGKKERITCYWNLDFIDFFNSTIEISLHTILHSYPFYYLRQPKKKSSQTDLESSETDSTLVSLETTFRWCMQGFFCMNRMGSHLKGFYGALPLPTSM